MADVRELLRGAIDAPDADALDVAELRGRARRRRRVHRAAILVSIALVVALAGSFIVDRRTHGQRTTTQPSNESSLAHFPLVGTDVTTTNDAVWLAGVDANDKGVVVRVDPATGAVVTRILEAPYPADHIVTAFGKVWVSGEGNEAGRPGGLAVIDPATNEAAAVDLPPDRHAGALAAAGDAVWVADPSAPFVFRVDARGSATNVIPIPNIATRLSANGPDIWASTSAGVVHVDARSQEVAAVGSAAEFPAVAAVAGSVWTVANNTIVRYALDGKTFTTQEAGSSVTRLVADGDRVWVADAVGLRALDASGDLVPGTKVDSKPLGGWNLAIASDGSVWRVDSVDTVHWTPTHDATAPDATPARPRGVRTDAGAVAGTSVLATADGIFVGEYSERGSEIHRVDPVTMAVDSTISLPKPVFGMAIGFDSLWAAGGGDGAEPIGGIERVDLATNKVVASIGPTDIGWTPRAIAVGADAVWVDDESRNLVLRIDPATNTITDEIPIDGPRSIAVSADGVWVGTNSVVWRIDPATRAARQTLVPGAFVAVAHDLVWVSTGSVARETYVLAPAAVFDGLSAATPVRGHGVGGELAVDGDGVWTHQGVSLVLLRPNDINLDVVPGSQLDGVSAEQVSAFDGVLWIAQFSGPLVRWEPFPR